MIPLLGAVSVAVETPGANTVAQTGPNRGESIAGASVSSTSLASVQPLSGDELQVLPEGLRTRARFKAYTEDVWQVADVDAGLQPALVTWEGRTFEVVARIPYPNAPGLRHRKYILATRVEQP